MFEHPNGGSRSRHDIGKRIRVYRNGDIYHKGIIVLLNTRQVHDINAFLDDINEKIGLIKGAKRLYTLDGHYITSMEQLEHNNEYVVSSSGFTHLPYVQTNGFKKSTPPVALSIRQSRSTEPRGSRNQEQDTAKIEKSKKKNKSKSKERNGSLKKKKKAKKPPREAATVSEVEANGYHEMNKSMESPSAEYEVESVGKKDLDCQRLRPLYGFTDNKRIRIIGTLFGAYCTINLLNTEEFGIYFHFSIKFKQRKVVRNSKVQPQNSKVTSWKQAKWQEEETDGEFPFVNEKQHAIELVAVGKKHVNCFVDGKKFCEYVMRTDFAKITHLSIRGNIRLASVYVTPDVNFDEERMRCLKEKRLYEDDEFPANDQSLFFSKKPEKPVLWKRPREVVEEPMLISEGFSRFDILQNQLGNCWFMAAVATLSFHPELLRVVIPKNQSLTNNYAGIFHFKFWKYGHWVDVVIDDRLPYDEEGSLISMHSKDPNEFWTPLLEKAYAKLYGSYEALVGGFTCEALTDMTGGLMVYYDLKVVYQEKAFEKLIVLMTGACKAGSLLCCSTPTDPDEVEALVPNGIVKGHAYSITDVRFFQSDGPDDLVWLIRIRNPWGQHEWNGPWSDGSPEWESIPEKRKKEIGLTVSDDGEFWMSLIDFLENFEDLEICNISPAILDEALEFAQTDSIDTDKESALNLPHNWVSNSHAGFWRSGQTSGGNWGLETFAMNPQYRIKLTDTDPDDDDDLCTVIISVLQKYFRELKHIGSEVQSIGFHVFKTGDISLTGRLNTEFFTKKPAFSCAPMSRPEVSGRFRMCPGEYIIVPCTSEPNEEANFMLRLFTNNRIESGELS